MYSVQWNCQVSGLLHSPVILPADSWEEKKKLDKDQRKSKDEGNPKNRSRTKMFSVVRMFFLYEEPLRKGPIPILLFVLCLQIWEK